MNEFVFTTQTVAVLGDYLPAIAGLFLGLSIALLLGVVIVRTLSQERR